MSVHDPVATAWGREAEKAAREAYTRLGYFVVPAHMIEDGGAPMLIGHLEKYVLPDFLIAKGAVSRWLEVKFKDHCVKFQITGHWRHGIDVPKWQAYCKVEEITGIPGSIAILQYRPGPDANPAPYLFMQTFQRLEKVIDIDSRPMPGRLHGMVYWNVDDMETVCKLDFNFTEIPRLTNCIHAWERTSKAGIAPQWNPDAPKQSRFIF